jgi:hypothetical protein
LLLTSAESSRKLNIEMMPDARFSHLRHPISGLFPENLPLLVLIFLAANGQ